MHRIITGLTSFTLLVWTGTSHAQIAFGLGGIQADSGHSVEVDGAGNTYVTGIFRQTVDFDPGPAVAELTVTSNTFFLASYAPGGAFRYVVPISGMSSTLAETGLEVDGSGNAYVAGSFSGLVDFDPGADVFNLSSANGNLFLASYDANGAFRFAFNIGVGAPFFEAGKRLAVTDDGDIFLTGEFSGVTDFDPGDDEFLLESNGINDIFLAGYTTGGGFRFAIGVGSELRDRGLAIAIDDSRNAYLTGAFRSTVDFEPGPGVTEATASGTNEDVFVASYTDGGALRYAFGLGSAAGEIGWGIDVDDAGNAFVTGEFGGTVDFDPDPGADAIASAVGNSDIFVASYTTTGAHRFSFGLGAGNPDVGRAIVVDPLGNTHVTGFFRDGFDFDPGPDEITLLTTAIDSFVATYSNSGAFIDARITRPLNTSSARANDIALDPAGNPVILGTYSGTVDLDLGDGEQSTTTNGADDVFVTALIDDTDTDGDDIADRGDNCTLIANADQRDTNDDGFGNACDPDLNNDGVVNVVDLGALRAVFFTNDADADFNGDGVVNVVDLGVMRSFFFQPPGPSGVVP